MGNFGKNKKPTSSYGTARFTGLMKNRLVQPVYSGLIAQMVFELNWTGVGSGSVFYWSDRRSGPVQITMPQSTCHIYVHDAYPGLDQVIKSNNVHLNRFPVSLSPTLLRREILLIITDFIHQLGNVFFHFSSDLASGIPVRQSLCKTAFVCPKFSLDYLQTLFSSLSQQIWLPI